LLPCQIANTAFPAAITALAALQPGNALDPAVAVDAVYCRQVLSLGVDMTPDMLKARKTLLPTSRYRPLEFRSKLSTFLTDDSDGYLNCVIIFRLMFQV
jgi:hypothetical protein